MLSDIVKHIINNGWLQGSLADIPENIVKEHGIRTNKCLVVTHSCDLANGRLDLVKFVTLLPVYSEELDKGMLYGKNARKLQFESSQGLTCYLEPFIYLPREILAGFQAKSILSPKDCDIFAKWLGNAYSRSAFPTEFNNRFSSSIVTSVKKEYKKFVKFLTDNGDKILNVFVKLNSWEELKAHEEYLLDIVIVTSLDYEDAVDELNDAFDDLMVNAISKCDGISLESATALATDQFTLQELMEYKLWQMDHISFRYDTDTAV